MTSENLLKQVKKLRELTGVGFKDCKAAIDKFDGDRNILTLRDVKGLLNEGDYCTTSDSKNFVIGKINPCTARGKLSSVALYDGNYLDDKGFPSVDSQRIHDSSQFQDYSYLIKVGKFIIAGSLNKLNKKGSTLSKLSGPPKLNKTTAFLI